jgi:hypothetical protein
MEKRESSEKAEPGNVAGNDHEDDEDYADFPEATSADPCLVLMPAHGFGSAADAADRGDRVVLVTHGKEWGSG